MDMANAMQLFRKNIIGFYVYGFLPLACCLPAPLVAEEFALFKLTGVEGNVGASYQSDELIVRDTSRDKLSTIREDLFILTHSYIYHPIYSRSTSVAG